MLCYLCKMPVWFIRAAKAASPGFMLNSRTRQGKNAKAQDLFHWGGGTYFGWIVLSILWLITPNKWNLSKMNTSKLPYYVKVVKMNWLLYPENAKRLPTMQINSILTPSQSVSRGHICLLCLPTTDADAPSVVTAVQGNRLSTDTASHWGWPGKDAYLE